MTLALDQVTLRYGDRTVLDDFSLRVRAGERLALLGPSGAGKSSLLRLLLGFIAPDRGEVRLRDQLASRAGRVIIPPEARNLAMVFQDLALWPHLSVAGNLDFGLRARGVPREERAARIARMLERVELGGVAERAPGELSGGEQQRVAIARALVLEPDAILLDEPLSNLDVGLRRDLLALFLALFREASTTVVYVTHDPREARQIADRVVIMEGGRLGALDGPGDSRFLASVRAVLGG